MEVKKDLLILGLSCFYHDSAAVLLKNGKIISAVQEERFSRKKFDSEFPTQSILSIFETYHLNWNDIDALVYYEKPFLKFERILETFIKTAPKSFFVFLSALPEWIRGRLNMKSYLKKEIKKNFSFKFEKPILFSEHHLSHAASAFYPSPFDQAAVLCLDGVGEWTSSSAWLADGTHLKKIWEIHFPHSLGLLYSAFTQYCGFKVNSGEYKLMGLAPYGKPIHQNLIEQNLIHIKDDGSYELNLKYFDYESGFSMINNSFRDLFGGAERNPEEPILQKHQDIAASIQKILEKVIMRMSLDLKMKTQQKNLCLAGGVALNCVANGRILKNKVFDQIWIQPSPGDAGAALGAALAVHHMHFHQQKAVSAKDQMQGGFLGPEFTNDEIQKLLDDVGASYQKFSDGEIYTKAADDLKSSRVVGWFRGRMEFGPRALGSRSILGDARHPDMQSQLNLKIKFRESFRPFAPAVIKERAHDFFQLEGESPYMLFVTDVPTEASIKLPATTHVDGSARVQTVSLEENPDFYHLLQEFERQTACPVLINTSFNVRGEPIVCSPEDALRCFLKTNMDSLVLGSFFLQKENQKVDTQDQRWERNFDID